MARIDRIVQQAERDGERAFSIEVLPPERFADIGSYLDRMDALVSHRPSFITVTYHQAQIVARHSEGKWSVERKQDRVGPDKPAVALQWKYRNIPAAPHLICGGFSKEETERTLVQLPPNGVQNVLCLRGDPNKERVFVPHPDGHAYASDLVAQVRAIADGKFVKPRDDDTFDFCIGVAGYPEKHYESANAIDDAVWAARKVDAGANVIFTQMCFDTDTILRYRDRLVGLGIDPQRTPIVPGLKVLSNARQCTGPNGIPARFSVAIPPHLHRALADATPDDARKIGQEWTTRQADALYQAGFPIIHLYTLNNPSLIAPVLDALGFRNGT